MMKRSINPIFICNNEVFKDIWTKSRDRLRQGYFCWALNFWWRAGWFVFAFQFGHFFYDFELPVQDLWCHWLSLFPWTTTWLYQLARFFFVIAYRRLTEVIGFFDGLELKDHTLDALQLFLQIFNLLVDLPILTWVFSLFCLRRLLAKCYSNQLQKDNDDENEEQRTFGFGDVVYRRIDEWNGVGKTIVLKAIEEHW